jgi:hypothetical protein
MSGRSTEVKYRAYLIGYAPPGWRDDLAETQRLMAASDLVAIVPDGIEMGKSVSTLTLAGGSKGVAPPSGTTLVCIGHEHGGKVVILSDETEHRA